MFQEKTGRQASDSGSPILQQHTRAGTFRRFTIGQRKETQAELSSTCIQGLVSRKVMHKLEKLARDQK
jgi:hypothetical protein